MRIFPFLTLVILLAFSGCATTEDLASLKKEVDLQGRQIERVEDYSLARDKDLLKFLKYLSQGYNWHLEQFHQICPGDSTPDESK